MMPSVFNLFLSSSKLIVGSSFRSAITARSCRSSISSSYSSTGRRTAVFLPDLSIMYCSCSLFIFPPFLLSLLLSHKGRGRDSGFILLLPLSVHAQKLPRCKAEQGFKRGIFLYYLEKKSRSDTAADGRFPA